MKINLKSLRKSVQRYILYIFCFFCFFCFLTCHSKTKDTIDMMTPVLQSNNKPRKVLYFLGVTGQDMQNFLNSDSRFVEAKYLDEKVMFKKGSHEINFSEISRALDVLYPIINQTGFCYLNIESPFIEMIRDNNPQSKEFKTGIDIYTTIVKYVKAKRPNVRFGIYSFPFTTYWGGANEMLQKNKNCSLLLNLVDLYFPSLYMYYDNSIAFNLLNDKYLSSNIENSLALATEFKKEVFPFVMSRYHPSNSRIGFNTISDSDWIRYIQTISNTMYNNKKIDGIFWWGADSYYFDAGFLKEKKLMNRDSFIYSNGKELYRKAQILSHELFK